MSPPRSPRTRSTEFGCSRSALPDTELYVTGKATRRRYGIEAPCGPPSASVMTAWLAADNLDVWRDCHAGAWPPARPVAPSEPSDVRSPLFACTNRLVERKRRETWARHGCLGAARSCHVPRDPDGSLGSHSFETTMRSVPFLAALMVFASVASAFGVAGCKRPHRASWRMATRSATCERSRGTCPLAIVHGGTDPHWRRARRAPWRARPSLPCPE